MKLCLLFLIILPILSCGNSSSDSEEKAKGFQTATYGILFFNKAYFAKCQQKTIEGQNVYITSTLKLVAPKPDVGRNSSMTVETVLALDSSCKSGIIQTHESGQYDFEQEATEIHLKDSDAWVKPLSQELANEYNKSKLCGKSNWKQGEINYVSNTNCYHSDNLAIFFVKSLDKNDKKIEVTSCSDNNPKSSDCYSLLYEEVSTESTKDN